MANKPLPKFLKTKALFWDSKFEALDREKNKKYIIERILEWGNEEAIKWLFKQYDRQTVKEIVKNTRQLSKKSLNFWGIILDLGERWRKKALARKQSAIWNY